jgi:hypothetical protein
MLHIPTRPVPQADARLARFDHAIAAMRNGATLHLQLSDGGPLWSLSDGSVITAETATLLLIHGAIELTSRLPAGQVAQAWKYVGGTP